MSGVIRFDIVIWSEFDYIDMFGRPMRNSPYFPHNSGALLLQKVLAMPRKKPISMQEACWMASVENRRLYLNRKSPEEVSQEFLNFMTVWVEWISEQGYHIELTGEDFDIEASKDRAA